MRLNRIAGLVAPSIAAAGAFMLAFFAGGDRLAATISPDGIWRDGESRVTAAIESAVGSDSSRIVHLNKDALVRELAGAPMEGGDLRNSRAVLSLPMPD